MHPRANMIRNIIVFFWDLWRAIGHIQHFMNRATSLNSLSWLPIFKLYICVQTWSTTPQCSTITYGRLLTIIQIMLERGPQASTVSYFCPLSNYTVVCKHDQQHHKVLWWFMKGYQQYSTFVEEGFQPQQSFVFAHLQVIHSCANIIHITIMFLCD